MYFRILRLEKLLKRKSVLLLGPRQTGKSTLIKQQFPLSEYPNQINLLKSADFLRYQNDPGLLIRQFQELKSEIIVIDEIQKLPLLLNDIHYLIEECGHTFLLIGSSARKFKMSDVNLLGGRAKTLHLHPLVSNELDLDEHEFLNKALSFGLLPPIWTSEYPEEDLVDYVATYLKEEIFAESVVRNLQKFSRLLEVAATCHGKILNYAKISRDIGLAPSTVIEHFKILFDTLIALELPSFKTSVKRKNIQSSKFYFFDMGIVRHLLKRGPIKESDADWGDFFESFIFQELSAYSHYRQLRSLAYWRSRSDFEVDFILNEKIAIEVKTTRKVSSDHLRGLKALKEEKVCERYLLISFDEKEQKIDGYEIIPWKDFLRRLWRDEFI